MLQGWETFQSKSSMKWQRQRLTHELLLLLHVNCHHCMHSVHSYINTYTHTYMHNYIIHTYIHTDRQTYRQTDIDTKVYSIVCSHAVLCVCMKYAVQEPHQGSSIAMRSPEAVKWLRPHMGRLHHLHGYRYIIILSTVNV